MQNKPNFSEGKNNANSLSTKDYRNISPSGRAKTNPIQTQYKANQTQFWPKNQGGKANTNPNKPNCSKGRKERFFAERELYFCFYNFARETYHPKGCQ